MNGFGEYLAMYVGLNLRRGFIFLKGSYRTNTVMFVLAKYPTRAKPTDTTLPPINQSQCLLVRNID